MPDLALDLSAATGTSSVVAATAELAVDVSIPVASGFVLVVSLALPAGVISGDTVQLIQSVCGRITGGAAQVSYQLRQGATVLDYTTSTNPTATAAVTCTSPRRIALVSNAQIDLYVSCNANTINIRPATQPDEHARIFLTKF